MTRGVGGSTPESELASMTSMRGSAVPITIEERIERVRKVQALLCEQQVQALYLDASSSFFYFTGVRLKPSERLHGAVIPQAGDLIYLCPAFEAEKLEAMKLLPGEVRTWQEHEDPSALVIDTVRARRCLVGHAGSG